MEYVLLAKVGMFVSIVVKSGYTLAGMYFLKTAYRYATDYKDSVANESGVK